LVDSFLRGGVVKGIIIMVLEVAKMSFDIIPDRGSTG